MSKVCPNCNAAFSRVKVQDKEKHCPHCNARIHVSKKRVVLWEDKECAECLVTILEQHISRLSRLTFTYSPPERAKELTHAYALIERSRNFLIQQPREHGLDPCAFVVEVVDSYIQQKSSPTWQIDTFLKLRNDIGRHAKDVYKAKRQAQTQNANLRETFTDFSMYLRPS